jgi:cytochrome c-type biogenesis protein CcmH/NrfG
MSIELKIRLDRFTSRLLLILAVAGATALLGLQIYERFLVGTLADPRLVINRAGLLGPARFVPASSRLSARLAEAEMAEGGRDLAAAEAYARRAIQLSPNDFRNRMMLAAIKEAQGDRRASEEALRDARRLAPNNRNVGWRLANLLVRQGKLGESLPEFRKALKGHPSYLPGALDLVWRASRGSVEALRQITSDEPRARLALAQFLVKQSHFKEAATEFAAIDRSESQRATETPALIGSLMSAGRFDVARDIWLAVAGIGRSDAAISNAGFESDIDKDLAQFDWVLTRSDFARVAIDTGASHSGARSVRIDFAGRDTTSLDNELRQLVVVRSGSRYRLECWARAAGLATPEAPRLVVTNSASAGTWLASSQPLPSGSSDWQRVAVEFIAPDANKSGVAAIYVSLKRRPKFSYDEPTKGTLWLDDFQLSSLD